MIKKSSILFIFVLIMLAGFVSADVVFEETFGSGTDWTTTVPGWTFSQDVTSGRDDIFSETGGSDGNRYAWIAGDSGDQYIEKTVSTSGYQNLVLSCDYNLIGSFGTSSDYIVVEWKLTTESSYNILLKASGDQIGWSHIVFILPKAAQDTEIDIRIRADDTEDDDFILVDNIKLTGSEIAECGDGDIDNGEECDDGNSDDFDECKNDCTLPECGNNILEINEECDDGNLFNDDTCDNNCFSVLQTDCQGQADGTLCDDDIFCNGPDECQDEICVNVGPEVDCSDGNDCTDDICNEDADQCENPDLGAGTQCGLARDCPDDQCSGDFAEFYPADGHDTCDGNGNCEIYSCNLETTYCTDDDTADGINTLNCGAECDSDSDCDDEDANTVDTCNLDTCGCVYTPTGPECGDGNIDSGEECDDGTENGVSCSPAYDSSCTYCSDTCVEVTLFGGTCGDDTIDTPDEECEKDSDCSTGEVCSSCVCEAAPSECGDGNIDSGEECDNGIGNTDVPCDPPYGGSCEYCDNTCNIHTVDGPYCNDDTVDSPDEECDDGLSNGDPCTPTYDSSCDYCSDICTIINITGPFCGDNVRDASYEECDGDDFDSQECSDFGFDYGTLSCTASCVIDTSDCMNYECGDGIHNPGEECDDGNNVNEDFCRNDCTLPYCGDNIIDSGEECDDGNFDNYDACPDFCEIAECGDGYVYFAQEECDDNNLINGDGCDENCTIEQDELCTQPIDVMFVMDRSGTMNQLEAGMTRLQRAKQASITFVNMMNFSRDIGGLASFNETGRLDNSLTSDKNDLVASINSLTAEGLTNIGQGIKVGQEELALNGRDTKVMILLSDGAPNAMTLDNGSIRYCFVTPENHTNCTLFAMEQAEEAKAAGIELFTIGLGVRPFTDSLLRNMSSGADDHYFSAPTSEELRQIYLQIAEILCPCGNGVYEPDLGEECDDGNDNNYDSCTNDCRNAVCGDGYLFYSDGEECEPPETTDNHDCIQTQFECLGAKAGIRDSYGDCDEECGCIYDNFEYQCIEGECGGECDSDDDCDDFDPETEDFCNLETCSCEYSYCGDGVVDFDEECDDANENEDDYCSNDCTLTYCGDNIIQRPNGVGEDGPLDDGYEECDDGNDGDNTDECLENCILPECGDGYIWEGEEECESDSDCPENQCEVTYEDYCLGNKLADYNNNHIMDNLIVSDTCDNTCENCDCTDCATDCSAEPDLYCAYGYCNAQCDSNDDCNDGLGMTIDTCDIDNCICDYDYMDLIEKDSKVAKAMPTSNFGKGRYSIVNPKERAMDRTYLRVDATPLMGQSFSEVLLKLAVFYSGANVVGENVVAYYCPEHDFDEDTINWVNQPIDKDCIKADTYTVANTVTAGTPETWHEFDITTETNNELTSGDGLFTIVLVSDLEDTGITDNSYFIQYLTRDYDEDEYEPTIEMT
ncbi:MAG: VWA domain-containing protein [Candidatus Lokiarchaeota archaeon]|nr:VWA domain-containing protein [Candidatus Woesearchaeota archaeon]MBD3404853.1 VWA domain-containing protein [Candidatus Lokiarchaeota archaeon]